MKMATLSVSMLAAVAGQAFGQFTVNGARSGSEPYTQLWVNNQPTTFGDSVPFTGTSGDAQAAVNGVEIRIPFSALGITSGAAGVKFNAVLGSGPTLSNQIIATDGLPANSAALGNGRNVNFTTISGNQFVSLSAAQLTPVATVPVMDGVLDGGAVNGVGGVYANHRVALNTNYTNRTDTTATSNGSEIDGTFAVVHDNGTPGDTSDDALYLFVAGNFNNFDRIAIFLDAVPGGQNRLLNGNANWGFGFVPGISAASPTSTDGLTFDAGFEPEAMIIFNAGGGPYTGYTDWVTIPTGTPDGNGGTTGFGSAGTYLGSTAPSGTGTLAGGTNTPNLQVAFNNLNLTGVSGTPAGLISPTRDVAFGSELCNLWGYADTANDRLHLFIAGNLENNYNSLVLFFDVNAADGQNQLNGLATQPPSKPNPGLDGGHNGLNRMGNGGISNPGDTNTNAGLGLKFESGFTADYALRVGNGPAPVEVYANAAVIRADGRIDQGTGYQLEFTSYSGGLKTANDPITFPGTFAQCQPFTSATQAPESNASPRQASSANDLLSSVCNANNEIDNPVLVPGSLVVAVDNSNQLGVTDTATTGAAAVSTGVELSLKLSELGWDGSSPVKLAGFIASGDYGFVSNQVLGGIDGGTAASLGEPSTLDLTAIPGTQVIIIPTVPPSACDSIDFNNDGLFPDTTDIDDFLSVFSGGPCSNDPNCGDIDFNNDGLFPDTLDIDALLSVFSGGPCLS